MKTQQKLELSKSKALWERAQKRIPCGTQTLSKAPNQFAEGVYPIYLDRGRGAHVWDVDGNEFIDYPMALGPMILGYRHPAVDEAIIKQLEKGITFSLMHPLEVELSEKIAGLVPCAEKVRFTKTGSEATQAAIRLARAHTGRKHVAACGYHGWHDWYIGMTARHLGVPEEIRAFVHGFDYNKIESLEKLFSDYPDQIAAVILEPVGLVAPADNFLQKVKAVAHQSGAVLIFDEIVTGFRFDLGGAQKCFGVTPDLATMGKSIAGGMPLNLVCGKKEVMDECERVFFSSTFGGETLSLAAALATLGAMEKERTIEQIRRRGDRFIEGMRAAIQSAGLSAEFIGFAPRQFLNIFGQDGKPSTLLKAIFWQECIRQGVLFGNAQYVGGAHTDADIERTLEVARAAFSTTAEAARSKDPAEFYDGVPPTEIFRKS